MTTVLAYFPSPPQGVWHLGWLPIRAYAFFIIVGIVAALIIGDRRWVARDGEPGVIYDIALWAVPFGLIGGRLYHVMTDWRTYFGEGGAGFAAALKIWDGGLGIWGAVALGGVGAWIACRRRGIPLPAFADAIAPGIILAQAIGRIGNYFNQELYGRDTTLPWGLEIFVRRDASGAYDTLNGVSTGELERIVQPTFLYELLWNLLVFAVLIIIDRRFKLGHGRLFASYVALYCVGRFWVELMRSDAATHIAGIRINSFTSTFVFIGAVVYIILAPKGREDPATLRGTRAEAEVPEVSAVTEMAEEFTPVAAMSGVLAAALIAGRKEKAETAAEGGDGAEPAEEAATEDVADEGEESPTEGLGAVEGEEVAEARDAAPAVHQAAVEAAAESAEVAGDLAETEEPAEEAVEPEAEAAAEPEEKATEESPADGEEPVDAVAAAEGLGAVEGEEVAEAEEAAPVVHQAAVEALAEAEEVAETAAQPAEEAETEEQPADESETEEQPAEESETEEQPAADGAEETAAAEEPAEAAEQPAEEPEPAAEGEEAEAPAEPAEESESEEQPAEEAESEEQPAEEAKTEEPQEDAEPSEAEETAEHADEQESQTVEEAPQPITPTAALPADEVTERPRWWRRLRRGGTRR